MTDTNTVTNQIMPPLLPLEVDVFQEVIPLLIQRLKEANDIPTSVPNMSFDNPNNSVWQAVQWVAGNPDDVTIGKYYYRENLEFQVFVHVPKDTGTSEINRYTNIIRSAFRKGTSINIDDKGVRISILETPQIAGVNTVSNFAIAPVLIPVTIEVNK